MVVILKHGVNRDKADLVKQQIQKRYPHLTDIKISEGEEIITLQIIGSKERSINPTDIEGIEGVERYIPILDPYKLVSKDFQPYPTIIRVGSGKNAVEIGKEFVVMGGPCSVDENTPEIAQMARDAGVKILRGGADKARTSPYSWQGMGEKGFEKLAEAGQAAGLPVIGEVVDTTRIELASQYCDILQVGMRNMDNYWLLKELSQVDKPVLLKRNNAATFDEWMLAAEYLLLGKDDKGNGQYIGGNPNVILCERGILSFDKPNSRNVADANAVTQCKNKTHLPVVGDPSHATGKRENVVTTGLAYVAAGADGLIVEAHYDPSLAKTDSAQTIDMKQLSYLVKKGEELYNSLRSFI
jgi:3-deoxy-7-phosphoheptulonate synthase